VKGGVADEKQLFCISGCELPMGTSVVGRVLQLTRHFVCESRIRFFKLTTNLLNISRSNGCCNQARSFDSSLSMATLIAQSSERPNRSRRVCHDTA